MNDQQRVEDNVIPLPVRAPTREVEPADPILDGELVDETGTESGRPWRARLRSWWLRSRRVPVWLKSRQHAVQAAKDVVVGVLRSPLRISVRWFAGAWLPLGGGGGG